MSGTPRSRRRATVAALGGLAVLALATSACGGDRPELAETSEPTTTTTEAPSTTTTEAPAPAAQVAQANESSIQVYPSVDAEASDRQIVSGVDTSVDTIPIVFLVKGTVDPDQERVEVYLPVRPNGSSGFVNADEVTISSVPYRIEVAITEHALRVFDGDEVIVEAPIGVGTTDTPSPGGIYYLKELLKPPNPEGAYGHYAYGLSGFSNVLTSFNGGSGVIGIHGTNDPGTIGTDVSHGCIRVNNEVIDQLVEEIGLPLGTPVEIQA
jgi:lipoprotein-anchoring transpeptidase ErfK/SrfK